MALQEVLFSPEVTDAGKLWAVPFIAAIVAAGVVFLLVFVLALYLYTSIALMRVFQKMRYKKAWMAWIPVVNFIPILQLGGFHWGWIFLLLIPIVGWIALFVLGIIAFWRIFEKFGYPGWLALIGIIPKAGSVFMLVMIGILAWGKNHPKGK